MTVASPAIAEREQEQVERANASTSTPVVFVHGLWLLPSSWDRWAAFFEEDGYIAFSRAGRTTPRPSPRRRRTRRCSPARASATSPTTTRRSSARSTRKPVIIGHSFGGLLTQILAGRGLAAASVAISPAPFRGVLPLPISALRSARRSLEQPGELEPRRPAHATTSSATASRTWSARTRRRSCTTTYSVPAAGRAALPGGGREPQSVVRGEGRHEEPGRAGRC